MSVSRQLARGLSCALLVALLGSGCSIRRIAVRTVAEGMVQGASVFATDDDPELVGEAIPFTLKAIEMLSLEDPGNPDLLLAACSGATRYAVGWVEADAESLRGVDRAAADRARERARKLHLRARASCFELLEGRSPGVVERLRRSPDRKALADFGPADVPALFWTGASWGSAIRLALDRPEMLADLPAVIALFERALELDEDWDRGTLHETMIALSVVPPAGAAAMERARRHYERARELSEGARASVPVTYAVSVAVPRQDRDLFRELLREALAIDPDARPSDRLANVLHQRRARLLLEREDDLFL